MPGFLFCFDQACWESSIPSSAARKASMAAGTPAYTAQCSRVSRISSTVQPLFSAPRTWPLSSCGHFSAVRADRVIRLRVLRSRPSRVHTPPHACSLTKSCSGWVKSVALPRARSTKASPITSRRTFRPCAWLSLMRFPPNGPSGFLLVPGAAGDDHQGYSSQRQGVTEHGVTKDFSERLASRRQHQVNRVCHVVGQEQQAFPAVDAVAGEENWQAGHGHSDHYWEVKGQGVGCDVDRLRRYHRGQAEHAEQVEDVAADDVAHGDIALALDGGHDRGGQFWQRSADGDHGQADHQFRNAQGAGHGDGALDQKVGACDQQHQASNDQAQINYPGVGFGRFIEAELLGKLVILIAALVAARA